MSDENGSQGNLLKIVLGVFLLLFLFRFAGRLGFLFLMLLIIAGLVFGIYFLWQAFQKRRAERRRESTLEGKAYTKMKHCEEQISRNEQEANEVKKSIFELRKQLEGVEEVSPRKKAEANRLMKEFESELRLRHAKIDFFRAAKRKLERIQRNKLLDETLSAKEEELKRLKEGHYEDLADMEALRSDMELETLYLDTIESLSIKMDQSKSMESVKSLQRELEEMTRDLE